MSGEKDFSALNAAIELLRSNGFRIVDVTTPATVEDYAEAFYELASMMDIGARTQSPKEVWEREMRPRLASLFSPASTDADLRDRVASARQTMAVDLNAVREALRLQLMLPSLRISISEACDELETLRAEKTAQDAVVAGLKAEILSLKNALELIAGSYWERVGTCRTNIEEMPDLDAYESMSVARTALANGASQ